MSLLLSLIMVISGPALAISEMAGDQADAPMMMDCSSMMSDATGTSGLIDAGSQPVLSALENDYQDPFLVSITPPPQFRS